MPCEDLARGRVRVVRGCNAEAWATDKHVRRFDVAVEHAVVVHVAQRLGQGPGHELTLCWVQTGGVTGRHLLQGRLVEREY